MRHPTNLAVIAAALTLAPSSAALATPVTAYETLHIANPDPEYQDYFGHSVAISGDVAIIGDYNDASGGRGGSGAAYLYDVSTGAQIRELTIPGSTAFHPTGWHVGIDGGTAIVGTPVDEPNGAAYLFDVATGEMTAKLTASDGVQYGYFGWSVDVSGDKALVGALLSDHATVSSGAAYLFDTTTGAQLAKFTANDPDAFDRFGDKVAIDGDRAIIGAYTDTNSGLDGSGSAYLFDVTTGEQIAKLTAETISSKAYFGSSVDVAGDTAIVGAYREGTSGAAYLFDANTGEQLHQLVAPDADKIRGFGLGVAIQGGLAVVGAGGSSADGVVGGALYVFDVATGDFLAKLVASNAVTNGRLGFSVDLDGQTIVAGAPNGLDPIGQVGDVYTFDASALAPSPVPAPAGLVLLLSALGLLAARRRRARAA